MIKILWAPPRQGKTWIATADVVSLLKKNRTVYTNWPVVVRSGKKILSSLVWDPTLALENIQAADIIIDEAYTDYNSREYKKFSVAVHTFFATNGHAGNNICLIAQNPNRIDVVIREMCNEFVFVKKLMWPIINRPLYFMAYTYLTEKEMVSRTADNAFYTARYWFNAEIANAYDTHYFRDNSRPIYQGITWQVKLKIEDLPPGIYLTVFQGMKKFILSRVLEVKKLVPENYPQIKNWLEEIWGRKLKQKLSL